MIDMVKLAQKLCIPEWRPDYPKTSEEIDLDNEAQEREEDLRERQEREERIKK